MATKKECKCLETIVHIVSDAVGLEALDTTIKMINSKMLSNGIATMVAFTAGSQINDFIQENIYVGKFMKFIKYQD